MLPSFTLFKNNYLLFNPGFSEAENVTQTPVHLEILEGEQAKFDCKYKTVSESPDLFWYVQKPGKPPHFILRRAAYINNEHKPGTRYTSILNKETTSIYLKISDVTVSDFGLYYCALRPTVSVSADCTVQEALTLSKVLTHSYVNSDSKQD
ncbi:T cell receptor alpha constant [Pelobates cultripes]|nr:T cell receptor alpha constant [Pelobates cultripes]